MDAVLEAKESSGSKRELYVSDSVDSVVVAGHNVAPCDHQLKRFVYVLTPGLQILVNFQGRFGTHNQVHNIDVQVKAALAPHHLWQESGPHGPPSQLSRQCFELRKNINLLCVHLRTFPPHQRNIMPDIIIYKNMIN